MAKKNTIWRMTIIAWVTFIVIAFLAHEARAASFQFHLASKHADSCACNERNFGIGYIGDGDGARLIVGYYRNSWWRDSFYAGVNFEVFTDWTSLSLTGVTGYDGTSEKADDLTIADIALPAVFMHADFGPPLRRAGWWPDRWKATPFVTYAPTKDGGVGLLSFNWKW